VQCNKVNRFLNKARDSAKYHSATLLALAKKKRPKARF
jgi:hypothetical protein